MEGRVCLIHALMCWAFEVGPGHPARHTVTSRIPKKVPRCSWGAGWEGATE